jgi:hypothetical protein
MGRRLRSMEKNEKKEWNKKKNKVWKSEIKTEKEKDGGEEMKWIENMMLF